MKNFDYVRPASVREAIAAASVPGATYLAAGTNLLDLMKGGVTRPDRLWLASTRLFCTSSTASVIPE